MAEARILTWVRYSKFKRVALQFPPALSWQAPDLVARLQRAEPAVEWFVLGDTSYGDCCVDEVNASHYGADCVVHFGFSCQTAPQRLPVLCLFPESDCTLPTWSQLETATETLTAKAVLIVCDPSCAKFEFPITAVLASSANRFPGGVQLAKLRDQFPCGSEICDFGLFRQPALSRGNKRGAEISVCNRPVYSVVPGGKLKSQVEKLDKSEISVLFVGPENSPLLERLTLEFSQVWRMSEISPLEISRCHDRGRVMRRYAGVERVKLADRVGVLYAASSLSEISRTREVLSRLLRAAGKNVEGFCVGKLTEEKLGNFPEIDCFVVLGCPEFINTEILPRSKNFHCPLVTAYEALLACGLADWDGTFNCAPEMPDVPDFREEDLLDSLIALEQRGWVGLTDSEVSLAPAIIEPGLDGIPARYRSEIARA